ncbi:DUF975 family protein [Enterococcus sp. BWB1-3]|uniref:DUF975 family protein n=1 Tax=Enterococcus sp. BWB1-3 TaxID=2787713 RepID=UPI001921CCE1|nr:DUF975 family protein [Enterococcus sp. BWB1-3]MBL1230411.1 DUF975 family protein [Enterococcus sp. BWB1-3]
MISSEIKKKAKQLLHKNYGHWSTLVVIPFVLLGIYFFFIMIFSIAAATISSHTYYDDSNVYRSWQDGGTNNNTYGDYWDGYDDGYNDGWDDGWDEGWDAYHEDDYYYDDEESPLNIHVPLSTSTATLSNESSMYRSYHNYGDRSGFIGRFFVFLVWLLIMIVMVLYQGMIKWAAVDNIEGEPFSLKLTFNKFFNENRSRVVKANLLVWLYTFLWALLFYIPGIVKRVSYSMTNYLLRKDEKLTAQEAIALSMELMKGYKMEYFMFTLSFALWYFSAFFSIGISLFHIIPYFSVSEALFFDQLIAEKHHLFSHELEAGFTDF